MSTGDSIALAGAIAAVVGIGAPIGYELWVRERRFRSSVRYRLTAFFETSKYAAAKVLLNEPIDHAFAQVLQERASSFLEALSEGADLLEKQFDRIQREDPNRETRRLFHLMLVEVDRRLKNKPLSGDDILFAYFVGSLAALVADIDPIKNEALDIVALDEGWTDSDAHEFIQLAAENVLPGRQQAELARRRRQVGGANHTDLAEAASES